MSPSSIYLDNAATTAVDPRVAEAMRVAMLVDYGNPLSLHGVGRKAKALLQDCSEEVAELICCRPDEVVFTCGGTEADNLAVLGAARAARQGTVICSTVEHPAVYEAVERLAAEGFSTKFAPVDADGRLDMDAFQALLSNDTVLVSLMLVNNETGALQPVGAAVAQVRERCPRALIHTDAVQAFGKVPVDFSRLGVDLLSLSAHKIHGPKGAGALIARKGTALHPLFFGGSGQRPGTKGMPAIAGFRAAARLAVDAQPEENRRLRKLWDLLYNGLRGTVPDLTLNSPRREEDRSPAVCNVSLPGISGTDAVLAYDAEGVCVSAGSACSSGLAEPSRILLAQGRTREQALRSLRFSFGRTTTEADVQAALAATRRLRASMN